MTDWKPPDNWLRILAVDAHAAGEPLRVIMSGLPELPGDTILARRRYARMKLEHLRTALMWEPRGHADMYGCIVTPPVTPGADLGVLFMHNEGYSTMCGHGIIGVTTVALDTGMLPAREPETTVKIDTPAGLIVACASVSGGRVRSVRFRNVASFVLATDEEVSVPGLGVVRYDLAFGGAFYAYVEAEQLGLACTPDRHRALIETGTAIKRAVMAGRPVIHPTEEELGFLYGTIFTCAPLAQGADTRHVCVFADGEVDRSPTGTGVSGRLALLWARKQVALGQRLVFESVIGSRFAGWIAETTTFSGCQAVIPEVEGSAYITGRHEFLIDPEDPFREGFIFR